MLPSKWKSRAWALAMISGTAFGQSGPPPIPPVQSVKPMGIVTQDPLVQGRDNTFSAEINGISYWVFGDTTLTQDNASGTYFFSNSMAWATNLDAPRHPAAQTSPFGRPPSCPTRLEIGR